MIFYDKDYPFFIKLITFPSTLFLEFITALIGLIIIIIPTWTWGVSFIKKQLKKKEDIIRERKEIIEKITSIDKTVNGIDFKLKEFIAKDIAELRLSDKPTFICSEEGECIEANPALCDLFGANRDQMLGFGWSNFIVKEDRQEALEEWNTALKSNVDMQGFYRIDKGLTGEIINLYYRAVISRDENKNVLHILGQVYKK